MPNRPVNPQHATNRDLDNLTDEELERIVAQERAAAASAQQRVRAAAPVSPPVVVNSPAAPPAPDTRPPMSVAQVADLLGLHQAEVLELVRKGKLPAKRIGSGTFITAANLAAFIAKTDPSATFPRFERGDLVVWMDEQGEQGLGRFIAEDPDGSVRVLRRGFWGDYEARFAATQVQPFTCRLPAERLQ